MTREVDNLTKTCDGKAWITNATKTKVSVFGRFTEIENLYTFRLHKQEPSVCLCIVRFHAH